MEDTNGPVANPTWYADIRDMFTAMDIAHMKSVGVDLTSYDDVKSSAGSIYSQVSSLLMPPPPPNGDGPWSADQIATFLNWISNNYPKGTPPIQAASLFKSNAESAAPRIRKEVNVLAEQEPEAFDLVIKAFEGIMAKDPSDPNSYFVQAGYHWLPLPNYCLHHVPGYNPWHRGFLYSFENALRSVEGCENVTLPYWDITKPFPDVLKKAPFDSYTLPQDVGDGYNQGYQTERLPYDEIQQNLTKYDVTADVNRALTKTDWEDFHGFWSGATYNTIIAAHDAGHDSIGTTMQNPEVAAFDPIFWFFHCNWDRLYWEWQTKMQATTLNGLLTTINKTTDINSYNIFTVQILEKLTMNPFSSDPLDFTTLSTIDSVNSLGVDYTAPADKED